MLSAIIDVCDGVDPSATFASLSDAATDGFLREVIVADPSGSASIAAIAEEAGARLITAGDRSLVSACAEARQVWLLLLRSGVRLESGWEQAAWRHINGHTDRAGWFRLSLKASGLSARMEEARADLEARLFGRLRAEHGLLVSRRHYNELSVRWEAVALPLRARPLRRIEAHVLADGPPPQKVYWNAR